jgi:hypothetical protein
VISLDCQRNLDGKWIKDIREGGLCIVLAVNLVGSGSDSGWVVSDAPSTRTTYLRPRSEIRE